MYTELTIYHNYLENLSVNCQKTKPTNYRQMKRPDWTINRTTKENANVFYNHFKMCMEDQ